MKKGILFSATVLFICSCSPSNSQLTELVNALSAQTTLDRAKTDRDIYIENFETAEMYMYEGDLNSAHDKYAVASSIEGKYLQDENYSNWFTLNAAAKTSEVKHQLSLSDVYNGHKWVDLGIMPKWATCNVGASEQWENGKFFLQNDTTWQTIPKSEAELLRIPSLTEADADTWYPIWELPSPEEWQDLIDKCRWEWMDCGGEKGYWITGPNGMNICLPVTGHNNSSYYMTSDDSVCVHLDKNKQVVEALPNGTKLSVRLKANVVTSSWWE